MGFSRKRIGRDGKPRYTAYYLDIRGQERSAGTFPNKKDANDAWKKAEGTVSGGKPGDPSRGKQTFEAYALDKWLPHHQPEPGVRSNYAGHIRNHLLPFFGPMKMRDIMPEHVREWVTVMKGKGASAQTIQYCKGSVLNALFTTALTDGVVTIHPSHGVKTPPAPGKPRRIITPAQFDCLYQALPDPDAQLLAETAIESGMRWGELTETRTGDVDFETCILTVSRAVVELTQDDHPDGGRFLVKDYPKGQGIPAVQAQRPDHRQDPAPRHREEPRQRRPDLHVPATGTTQDQAPRHGYGAGAGNDGTERERTPVPARNPHRLQRGEMPVRALPRRVRRLSCQPPVRRQGQPPHAARQGHRRAYPG
jgi:hypothetical protein